MKNKIVLTLSLAGLALGISLPALAHHSFAAEYDANKPLTLTGTVAKVEWMNPHIWLYLDGKTEGSPVARWQCEGGAPNSLVRQGWSRTSLKPGDQIVIDGFRSKDGTNTCNSRSVKFPDGRKVFAGSSDDGGPNARGAKQ